MMLCVAKEIGRMYESIELLQLNGLINDREARRAMRGLVRKASRCGVGLAYTGPDGQRLLRQIRVHWVGSRGQQINRYYPPRREP